VTDLLRRKSAQGRGVLAATILGSGMAFLDSTVVNIATAHIGEEFHASFGELQWVVNAYMLTLAAFILMGGSLGDRLGRKRVFMIGVTWFALASLWCAVAPGVGWLIAARAVQGVGAALMTPGSLAIISAVFVAEDRPAAVGTWSGLTGVASALGPLLGGWLVQDFSWRWAFGINVPIAVAVLFLAQRFVPETRSHEVTGRLDIPGVAMIATALAALTYGTIHAGASGWDGVAIGLTLLGIGLLVGFVFFERNRRAPLVPMHLFADRVFLGTNSMTLLTYGALGVFFFLLTLQLQVVAGFGPFAAGLAGLPMTILLLLFSASTSKLAARVGPRLPLALGTLIAGAGLLLTLRIDSAHTNYWLDVLPGVTVFAIGMTFVVAPLTATVMGAAPSDDVGIASGINNAIARTGGLLAVAIIPPLAGLQGEAYRDAALMTHGYRVSMVMCAILMACSAAIVVLVIGSRGSAQRARTSRSSESVAA
jgi:EmrB/QacA subfamily drug resistance transporter